ncbi:MAG: TetR family transcriptional regulator [Lentisphaeria bacterium]|jgi:AcrR family transcriptional regulator|nr:TetR family transcriptional regulator [Lentisphaeria bacterium]
MRREDKMDARDRLLVAGLKFFANKGYDGATVREICDEAKSNIAAINYYFGDKEGFYSAVKEYAIDIRHKAMERCWELVETDPWGALKTQIEIMLDETFDDTMFQVNWLFFRELLDRGEIIDNTTTDTLRDTQSEARRKQYVERMNRLLGGLLGPEAATPENFSLLHYTYHSLCRFLPIKSQWETRMLRGKAKFSVKMTHDKESLTNYIIGIVRHAVEEMQKQEREKKNGHGTV